MKRVYVEQGFREAVEPKGHCLFRFGCEVFFLGDPYLDGSHVADVSVGVALFVFSACSSLACFEICVLSDGETSECGLFRFVAIVRTKITGTERVGSMGNGVPSEAVTYERTSWKWKEKTPALGDVQ